MTWSRRSYPGSLNLMVPTWFVCIRFCELVMFLPDKGHGPTQKHLVTVWSCGEFASQYLRIILFERAPVAASCGRFWRFPRL